MREHRPQVATATYQDNDQHPTSLSQGIPPSSVERPMMPSTTTTVNAPPPFHSSHEGVSSSGGSPAPPFVTAESSHGSASSPLNSGPTATGVRTGFPSASDEFLRPYSALYSASSPHNVCNSFSIL